MLWALRILQCTHMQFCASRCICAPVWYCIDWQYQHAEVQDQRNNARVHNPQQCLHAWTDSNSRHFTPCRTAGLIIPLSFTSYTPTTAAAVASDGEPMTSAVTSAHKPTSLQDLLSSVLQSAFSTRNVCASIGGAGGSAAQDCAKSCSANELGVA